MPILDVHSESPSLSMRDDDAENSTLPLYRRWRKPHMLANESLASSSELLRRAMLGSLLGNTREGMLIMDFCDGKWRSDSCKVERWYQNQLARSEETCSTTQFTTIQHRSTLNAPFFHEYLLIYLLDGSLYRVERTGQGSNTDAIGYSGCDARDLIEWWPAKKYEAFAKDKPSRLIAEVQFSQVFDIVDILAICYSVQQNKQARHYTLQRFNCYFLCCTVLCVLARRCAEWEVQITFERQCDLLNRAFSDLASLSSNPLKPEAKTHFVFRICSLLDPDNSQPAGFLLDQALKQIQSAMNVGNSKLHHAVPEALWWSNYGPLVLHQLDKIFDGLDHLFGRDYNSIAAEVLKQTDDGAGQPSKDFRIMYAEEYFSSVCKHLKNDYDEALIFGTKASGPNLYVTLANKITVPFSALQEVSAWYSSSNGVFSLREVPLPTGTRLAATFFLSVCRFGAPQVQAKGIFGSWSGAYPKRIACSEVGHALLDRLEKFNIHSKENVIQVCKMLAKYNRFKQSAWENSLMRLISETLSEVVKSELAKSRIRLVYTTELNGKTSSQQIDVFEFQEHIRAHIRTYAIRVDRKQLGSSEMIWRDVEEAMFEIWDSMPDKPVFE